ncbi:hypothetical protein MIMGU_mgv1a020066mg [Erythranthe guttata]|uniref:Uncharacterized protein n=1 Tax=Erythranthe guttata TaxID=4155 RepID=A0A022RGE7_ERYGU|nr:hypothetical protein MIMGU_mgv1a020066mg [Erythranthe guttata]
MKNVHRSINRRFEFTQFRYLFMKIIFKSSSYNGYLRARCQPFFFSTPCRVLVGFIRESYLSITSLLIRTFYGEHFTFSPQFLSFIGHWPNSLECGEFDPKVPN